MPKTKKGRVSSSDGGTRRERGTVPATSVSTSSDGFPERCTAGRSGEFTASVKAPCRISTGTSESERTSYHDLVRMVLEGEGGWREDLGFACHIFDIILEHCGEERSRKLNCERDHAMFEILDVTGRSDLTDAVKRELIRKVICREPLEEGDINSLAVMDTEEMEKEKEEFAYRQSLMEVSDSEPDVPPSPGEPLIPPPRRGRGRPPTTGEYVGYAEAKRKALEAEQAAAEWEAEKEVTSVFRRAEKDYAALQGVAKTPDGLATAVEKATELVEMVAAKSGNLKGTYIKHLKGAATLVRGAVKELVEFAQGAPKASKALARRRH